MSNFPLGSVAKVVRMMRREAGTAVLFVCMGNICRSPTLEGVFRTMAAQSGIQRIHVDSAATHDYHTGAHPDERAILAARRRGFDIAALRARTITRADFDRFGWIFAMDRANLRSLGSICPPDYSGHLGLLLDLLPELGLRDVPDPYYGGTQGFERVLDLAEAASEALVARLVAPPDS